MPTEVLMPALSPTMEEGTLAKWLVKEGDEVSSGDLLAEIETDKATMEFEAVDEGTIGKILVAEGTEGVKVNTPIAVLLDDGESADDIGSAAPATAPAATAPAAEAPAATPAAPAPARALCRFWRPHLRLTARAPDRRRQGPRPWPDQGLRPPWPHCESGCRKRPARCCTRRPAQQAAPAAAPAAAAPAGPSTEAVLKMYEGREYEDVKLDGMRKTIAARLTEAKQTIPHFYLRRDIHLDALLKFRSQLNKTLEPRGIKLSVNDFIIKACAIALQRVPDANAVWAGDRMLKLKPSDVAVAVAIEGGLFTPVLKDAHIKSLSALSAEMKDLAARARDRKLAPHEYQGGSFAISNLGMFGIDNFDAVINPPHGSILAVGAGVKKPVVGADGELTAATVMSTTLSVDHRVIDGALGAQFLDAIKDGLENPVAMLA